MDKPSSRYKHLLLIRLSALGDIAMVPHAVRAVRARYPDLRITILSRGGLEPLFEGLDVEFVVVDMESLRRGWFAGYRDLARKIADLGVDAVADLHDVIRTKLMRIFLRRYNVAIRHIDKGHDEKKRCLNGACNGEHTPLRHTVTRYCDVIRRLGFEFDDPQPATKIAHPNPMPFDKGAGEQWVGVAPFSANEGKCYPLPLVSRLVAQLAERYDRIFIHTGPGQELEFADQMERAHANVVGVFNRVKLADEIDLIANEDCIVTMDSFAMHIAALTATPSVSVWGATHPSLGYSGYGTSAKNHVQLGNVECRPCSSYGNKECRFGDYRCMTQIDPSQVADRVAAIIDECRN
ncbi:MAG: glycosyltransferase family 9 protein [Rikenellaceae bacterium]